MSYQNFLTLYSKLKIFRKFIFVDKKYTHRKVRFSYLVELECETSWLFGITSIAISMKLNSKSFISREYNGRGCLSSAILANQFVKSRARIDGDIITLTLGR